MEYRLLTVTDYEVYYDVRSLALSTSPTAFRSTNEEEESYRQAGFTAMVDHPTDFILGAFDNGNLIGILGFWRYKRGKVAHKADIKSMFVHPEWRKRGIGKALMEAVLIRAASMQGLRQIQLSVVSNNVAAIRLYEQMGFVAYGLEKEALWVDGKAYDIMLMAKTL